MLNSAQIYHVISKFTILSNCIKISVYNFKSENLLYLFLQITNFSKIPYKKEKWTCFRPALFVIVCQCSSTKTVCVLLACSAPPCSSIIFPYIPTQYFTFKSPWDHNLNCKMCEWGFRYFSFKRFQVSLLQVIVWSTVGYLPYDHNLFQNHHWKYKTVILQDFILDKMLIIKKKYIEKITYKCSKMRISNVFYPTMHSIVFIIRKCSS